MKKLVNDLEALPLIVRLILVLVWGIYGNILRLLKSLVAENTVGIILSIVLLLCGGFIVLWIFDIFCVLTKKPIWWIC